MDFVILRKRLIPDEEILLTDDEYLYSDEDMIITRWKAFTEHDDLSGGISIYYLKKNIKFSAIFSHGEFNRYYIDTIEYTWNEDRTVLTALDLLADVVYFKDGNFRILDLDELAETLENGQISKELAAKSLKATHEIYYKIVAGEIEELAAPLKPYI